MLERAPIGTGVLRADGGATANAFLMQLQADLIGSPVEVAADADATALGAAALAGLAIGTWRDTGRRRVAVAARRTVRAGARCRRGGRAPRGLAPGARAGDAATVTLVIAHRGASAEETENTLPAFERAIELGADYIELDVQASSDGALVVFHDLLLDRLTPLRGPLRARPLAALREHEIPTLAEVLELTSGRVGLMVEIKSPWLYRRPRHRRRAPSRLLNGDAVVLSFSRRAILETRKLRPDLRTMQHVGVGVPIRRAAGAWAAGFRDDRVTTRGLARARALGLETAVYTVNDEERMRELADLGVDGIVTDVPDLALAALGRRPSS